MKLLLVVFLAAAVLGAGEALRCYQCSSRDNPKCGDEELDLSTVAAVECSYHNINYGPSTQHGDRGPFVCRKITLRDDRDHSKTVYRGCASNQTACESHHDGCHVCEYDRCNAASVPGAAALATLAASLLARRLL